MSDPFRHPMILSLLAVAVVGALVALGCSPNPEIREYTVSKEVPRELQVASATAEIPTGLLGAIVPLGEQAWFFKVMGPAEAVSEVGEEFRNWVTTVHFDGGKPHWKLPEGWREQPGTGMRFATIAIPAGGEPLEASVIELPLSGPLDEAVAANVNRWRGQVGLEASQEPRAGAEVVELQQGDRQAYLVELAGIAPGAGSAAGGMPPMAMAGGGAPGMPPAMPSAPAGGPQTDRGELTYIVPEGWRPGREGMMRLAAFEAGSTEAPVEITVIRAGGDEEGNVRRWLGQIQAEVTDEELQAVLAESQAVEALGVEGRLYRLLGDGGQATYAAILPQADGMSMFVKMSGDASTAEAEAEAFESFVRSLASSS